MTRRQNISVSKRRNRRMKGTGGVGGGEGRGQQGRLFNRIGKLSWRGRDLQF